MLIFLRAPGARIFLAAVGAGAALAAGAASSTGGVDALPALEALPARRALSLDLPALSERVGRLGFFMLEEVPVSIPD